jgi:hypothetical protein
MLGNNSNNNQLTEQLSHVGARIPVRSITLVQKAGSDTEAWPGQKVECRVTEYNKKDVSEEDKDGVKWVIRIGWKVEELDAKGAITQIKIKKEWAGKEVFVMPYLHILRWNIVVRIKVKRFPIIIAESHHKRELSEEGSLANDLHCGDLTEEEICRIFRDPAFGNAEYLFNVFKKKVGFYFAEDNVMVNEYECPEHLNEKCYKTKITHSVNLKSNIMSMIEHFKNGKRKNGPHDIGADYSNENLTTAVMCHPDTIRFFNDIRKGLAEKLKIYKGNIIKIEKDKITSNNTIKGSLPIQQPIYGIGSDITWKPIPKGKGLTIALNDTWAYEVQIAEYQYNEEEATYQGKMKIIIYDHFGLDNDDVKSPKVAHFFENFACWFVLQRWKGFEKKYKPFVTVIEKELPFKGRLDP